ncbi:MAG TPA: type II toxin-antitoxin system RelE/ParE family toxin [Terriglobales bacterium]|nr:type II toxin-antitoxin system RelE/ParE family toxin [Terriglobales bacterium]
MSVRAVAYHEGATADVKQAVAWYQKRSPKAALDFIEELHRAAETIRDAPDRWPAGKNNTRRFLLWRFPFSIIYSERESVITIWAVAHGSRRPEYWARRLK